MGAVKLCSVCSRENDLSAFFCVGCGASLIGAVQVRREADVPIRPETWKCSGAECQFEDNPDSENRCLRCGGQRRRGGDEAGEPLKEDAQNVLCRTTLENAVFIQFPFGRVRVADRLHVGRDRLFSEIASEISGLTAVSRRHAEIYIDSTSRGIFLKDLGSTNSTFVNGKPIEKNTSTEIFPGDELSFSRSLSATVDKE